MRCPKCRAPVDFTRPDCSSCGVDLLQEYEGRARKAEKANESSTLLPDTPRPRLRSGVALAALAAAASVAAWAWIAPGRGRDPAARLFALPAHGFAFQPPAGWTIEEPAASDPSWDEAVRLTRAPATLQVLVGPPRAASAEAVAQLAHTRFNGATVRVQRVESLPVAGREAWTALVSGERAMLPSPNRGRVLSAMSEPGRAYESMDLQGQAVLVPGLRRSFLILLYSEREDFDRQRAAFQRFLGAFELL